ncbi:MAG: hypothetical protein J6Y20_04880 [Lachnospiraceae bacterium]|nr:hypothetical protein [Kiritimatiellia bacterium]MBP5461441.1 hypothetical protein [Lachnospiraceae bacterium]
MATFKFEGTIYVQDVDTAQDAINALQTALDDYEDMNPGGATIVIQHDMPARIEEKQPMGRYFKVINKNRMDGHIDYIDNNARCGYAGSDIYDAIEDIVGDMECPDNGIPYKIEVDGWADLACEGEIYETEDFVVACLSEEEYNEYQD